MPDGKNFDFEFRSKRGVSVADAQTTTMCELIFRCVVEPVRWNSTPSGRPRGSTVISRAKALGITRQRPVAMACGISVTSVDDLAPTSHPKPLQKGHWTQAGRPDRKSVV